MKVNGSFVFSLLMCVWFAVATSTLISLPFDAMIGPILASLAGLILAGCSLFVQNANAFETEQASLKSAAGFILASLLVLCFGFGIGGPLFALIYARVRLQYHWLGALCFALPAAIIFGPVVSDFLGGNNFEGLVWGDWW